MGKLIKVLVIAVVLAALFIKCDKDNDDDNNGDNITIFKATLEGSNEVPPNPSTATGSTTLTFDESTRRFVSVTTYTGITPSAGHIHNAPEGENGGIEFPFEMSSSPIIYESGVLTQEQIDELFDGRLYVNLHTEEYPAGEIRGQLIRQ